jgi:hypothetical protein
MKGSVPSQIQESKVSKFVVGNLEFNFSVVFDNNLPDSPDAELWLVWERAGYFLLPLVTSDRL